MPCNYINHWEGTPRGSGAKRGAKLTGINLETKKRAAHSWHGELGVEAEVIMTVLEAKVKLLACRYSHPRDQSRS
jgi:hypothetical protein